MSRKARLIYVDLDDLTATRDVAGVVGKKALSMATPKGEAIISGNLDDALPIEIPFTGQITWALGVRENNRP